MNSECVRFRAWKRLVFKNFSQDHLSSEHHKKCMHEKLGILANNGSWTAEFGESPGCFAWVDWNWGSTHILYIYISILWWKMKMEHVETWLFWVIDLIKSATRSGQHLMISLNQLQQRPVPHWCRDVVEHCRSGRRWEETDWFLGTSYLYIEFDII